MEVEVFQHLNANVALNGLSNVYSYNLALGNSHEELSAYVPDLTTFNFPSAIRVLEQIEPHLAAKEANLRYEARPETLQVRRMDDFSFRKVRLMKIDVEFMELQAIFSAILPLETCFKGTQRLFHAFFSRFFEGFGAERWFSGGVGGQEDDPRAPALDLGGERGLLRRSAQPQLHRAFKPRIRWLSGPEKPFW